MTWKMVGMHGHKASILKDLAEIRSTLASDVVRRGWSRTPGQT